MSENCPRSLEVVDAELRGLRGLVESWRDGDQRALDLTAEVYEREFRAMRSTTRIVYIGLGILMALQFIVMAYVTWRTK